MYKIYILRVSLYSCGSVINSLQKWEMEAQKSEVIHLVPQRESILKQTQTWLSKVAQKQLPQPKDHKFVSFVMEMA